MTSNTFGKIPAPSPLVLLADDLPEVINSWVNTLTEYGIPCLTVSSLEALDRAFNLYRNDISAVILDGCIPGHAVNTIDFILGARGSGFTAPIVASSSSSSYRAMMVRAGCSHQAPKAEAAHVVADLLSRPI
jgi:CheY-like chemotaxis protein